jgi:hypothetical protein
VGEVINPFAWAQAANNESQSFWTREGRVTDLPLQQAVIARISHVTSRGSRHAWDSLRGVHVVRRKDRRFEAVLEVPQGGRDLSGRHLLISVHASFERYEMTAAAEAMTDVLTRSDSVEVAEGAPRDLERRLTQLADKELSVATRVRRILAARR